MFRKSVSSMELCLYFYKEINAIIILLSKYANSAQVFIFKICKFIYCLSRAWNAVGTYFQGYLIN